MGLEGRHPILDISGSGAIRYSAPVTLLLELHAFLQEDLYCGELDSAVEEVTPNTWRVWFTCLLQTNAHLCVALCCRPTSNSAELNISASAAYFAT